MSVFLRPVTVSDCELICRHRKDMFAAAGDELAARAALSADYRTWQAKALATGDYFGFIADLEGRAVGGIGLMVLEGPPHPHHPASVRRGYVLNLFVEPDHRGKGIARKLMDAADQALKDRNISFAALMATDQARPIYEKDGWRQTAQMMKQIF